jgi:hypothetical protein
MLNKDQPVFDVAQGFYHVYRGAGFFDNEWWMAQARVMGEDMASHSAYKCRQNPVCHDARFISHTENLLRIECIPVFQFICHTQRFIT